MRLREVRQHTRERFGRHRFPHFDCIQERDCTDSDEPGFGHICACSCRRCSVHVAVVTGGESKTIEVCVCPGCDTRSCGLHTANGAHGAHD